MEAKRRIDEDYKVYWIHLAEHTDPSTDGYIGVTKNTERRFSTHKWNAQRCNKVCKVLEKAINKYKDKLIYSILMITNKTHAYFTEKSLRPSPKIGWNISIGGENSSGMLGVVHSESSKIKMSKAKLGKLRGPYSETTKERMREAARKFLWITPFGVFETLKLAEEKIKVSAKTVQNRCLSNNPKFSGWKKEIANAT